MVRKKFYDIRKNFKVGFMKKGNEIFIGLIYSFY